LKLFLQDSIDELITEIYSDGKLLIEQNIKVSCSIDKPVVTVHSQKTNGKFECILKPKTTTEALPSTLILTVKVSSI